MAVAARIGDTRLIDNTIIHTAATPDGAPTTQEDTLMSSAPRSDRKPVSLTKLHEMRALGEPIVMVTAYDHPSAVVVEEAGVDVVLVGDSAANNVLGYEDTVPVTVEELLMLAAAVRRGLKTPLLVGDLPFGSYEASDAQAIGTAHRFVKEAGCDAVKLEGGGAMAERARAIVRAGVPVMGHVGLTPQTATALGGYRAQGRTAERARAVLEDALALQEAGCFAIVFEAIPAEVTDVIMQHMEIPIIGIGAGSSTDGQVLVLHDLLGMHDGFKPKFVKRYAEVEGGDGARCARRTPRTCARAGSRRPEHTYGIAPEELDRLRAQLPPHRTVVYWSQLVHNLFTCRPGSPERLPLHCAAMPRLAQLFAPKEREFFDLFEEAGANIVRAAELLERMLEHWPDGAELGREVVVCEQEGDRITHDIIQRLNSTFVTPIDREDIYALASALDDIVDFIEEVADFLSLYRIEALDGPGHRAGADPAPVDARDRRRDPAAAHLQGHPPLHRRGQPARERRRPRACAQALASLFERGIDPMLVIRWKDIFERLEDGDRRHRDAWPTSSKASSSRTSRRMDNDVVLWIVVGTALAFDFTNGFHDTANAVATSISTRAMAPRAAVTMAAALNFVGAFLSLAVAATIASGIVNAADVTPEIVFAGLIGAIAWNLATWYFGLPSSSSHALIGGVVGATLAAERHRAAVLLRRTASRRS